MSYTFGKNSAANLATIVEPLQRVVIKAMSFQVMDFSIIEGIRSLERQKELYDQGKSHIDGVAKLGKHNTRPSLAVDLLPYPAVVNRVTIWDDKERLAKLAGLMFAAAAIENVQIRWGGDWDGDGNNKDSNIHDMPHYELM